MIAAVCEEALDAARRAAPAGVEVRELPPDGFDAAALQQVSFIVPGWMSGGSLDVLAELPELRVVQVLSAGTDWIESRVPEWATLCNARGTRDIPMAEWALAWCLKHPAVTAVIPGCKSVEQVEKNARAAELVK